MVSSRPILHHKAVGIHPGAFVQPGVPSTTDVQDGVLWVDTSTPAPFALRCWRAADDAWHDVGTAAGGGGVTGAGTVLTACLTFLSHGASICNDALGKLHFNTPDVRHTIDATGYQLPAGHRLEQV